MHHGLLMEVIGVVMGRRLGLISTDAHICTTAAGFLHLMNEEVGVIAACLGTSRRGVIGDPIE